MDEKTETVNLNVLIVDRTYPLKVLKSDEEGVKNAVKLISELVKEYQVTFAGKDKQDYMAMSLLKLAVDLVKSDSKQSVEMQQIEEKISEIERMFASETP